MATLPATRWLIPVRPKIVWLPFWLPSVRQDRTPVRSRRDLSSISPVAGRRRTLPGMAKCPETRDCLRAVDRNESSRFDINSERWSFTCAPTATRTRDLLLRRHSRNGARWCLAWPDVPFCGSDNGWAWPDVALCLWSLAPRSAPRDLVSKANVRRPGPDAITGREPRNRPHPDERGRACGGRRPMQRGSQSAAALRGLSALRVLAGAERVPLIGRSVSRAGRSMSRWGVGLHAR